MSMKFGNIDTTGPVGRRDAFHVPAILTTCDMDLEPGDPVRFRDGVLAEVYKCERRVSHGIADPFAESIRKDRPFWVLLNPALVENLTHASKSDAEEWLRKFADKWNFNYDEMVFGAMRPSGYGVACGIDLHSASEIEPGDEEEFWENIESVTGRKFDAIHRKSFSWSCSC